MFVDIGLTYSVMPKKDTKIIDGYITLLSNITTQNVVTAYKTKIFYGVYNDFFLK